MIADRVGRAHRMFKKASVFTRPTPARQDAPFHRQGRSERRGESYSLPYAEPLSDATCLREALRRRQGTPLEDFFNILLDLTARDV